MRKACQGIKTFPYGVNFANVFDDMHLKCYVQHNAIMFLSDF